MRTVVVLTIGTLGDALRDCQAYHKQHRGEEFRLRRLTFSLNELYEVVRQRYFAMQDKREKKGQLPLDTHETALDSLEFVLKQRMPKHDEVVFAVHREVFSWGNLFDEDLAEEDKPELDNAEVERLFRDLGWKPLA